MTIHDTPAADDIKSAIAFYEARGWDWLSVVAYLSARAVGMWPLPRGWYYRKPKEPQP